MQRGRFRRVSEESQRFKRPLKWADGKKTGHVVKEFQIIVQALGSQCGLSIDEMCSMVFTCCLLELGTIVGVAVAILLDTKSLCVGSMN